MKGLPLSGPADLGQQLAQPALSVDKLLPHFQAAGPSRFFTGCADDLTPALFARLAPESRDLALAAAESVCLGRFDLLGYRGLSFGDPIDWQLDPVSGRRSSLVHWSAIDPTDAAAIGDCKVVWELNRHQFLVTLGVAYRTTGDERYAAAFAGLLREWIQHNPPGRGINWASSLEVSLRLVSWCWALLLFRKSPQLTPDLFLSVLAGIGNHASHIERYLSRHFSPNTHLTGEALGLFYAGVLFLELKSASRWRGLGQQILEEQVQRQVLSDGVYFEQATGYQRYTVEIYLHYLALAERNGLPVSSAVRESVQKMLDVLLALRRPDGGMPAIGDGDGGCLLPVVPRSPDDLRGLFATAAVMFERADYAWAAEGLQPEVAWLLGPAAIPAFRSLAPAPPREGSRAFPAGGYVVMRSDWGKHAHQLVFDVGPLGCPISAGHGHADLLSIQVSAFGEAYIVDPGTCAYSADRAARDHFRGTRAHATATIDEQEQAEPAGPFSWQQRPAARLRRFVSTPDFDLADGEHDAYARLREPVAHRRQVLFVSSPGYWVIVDDLTGTGEHTAELRYPFAPLPVAEAGADWVRAIGSGGRGLLVRAFADRPLTTRIDEGSYSPNYGQRVSAPVLRYSAAGRLPLRVVTLLVPVADSSAAAPAVAAVAGPDGAILGLDFGAWNQAVRFGAGDFTFERA